MATQEGKVIISTEDLASVPQAAKELGIHFATIYRWIDEGKIHPIRIANQVFITRDDIKALKVQRAKDNLMSVRQAAKELGVSFYTIYEWIEKGKVQPFRIGGQVFITVEEVNVLKQQRANNTNKA